MVVWGLPDTPPQNMPTIVAEANQTQVNGAWNAPYLADLAQQYNPMIRGWWQYYGAFYRTAMRELFQCVGWAEARSPT